MPQFRTLGGMTTMGDMRLRKWVGALLLSALAGLALWHSLVVRPGLGYKLESRGPMTLRELFGGAPYSTARTSFQFYVQAARFSGSTLYLTKTLRNHRWFLRRVAGLEVVVVEPSEARVYAGEADEACRADEQAISSRLDDGTSVRICPGEPESDYVLLESSRDELLFVARRDDR